MPAGGDMFKRSWRALGDEALIFTPELIQEKEKLELGGIFEMALSVRAFQKVKAFGRDNGPNYEPSL
ncbi:hypothetical protein TWF128_003789 [Orbilia oligospora]|nr:hypothetical protein TWF128_003789 [Orbilia oligospora]